ncbi:MAG: ArsR/SmtB family transcription factor [Magnetospiraceae bacterium]
METYQAVEILGSLAQETRLTLFRLVVAAGPEGLSAAEIARHVTVVPSSLAHHLSELTQTGLINSRRDGDEPIYSVRSETMSQLLNFLVENCCGGRPDLCDPIWMKKP